MPRLRAAGGRLVVLPDGTPEEELAREVADADLLLMCYARISRRVIAAAPRLKAIVKYGVGIDAIDIDAAREHGIPVVNVPAYAEETVAEGAFALLMALFKRFKPIHQAMQTEGWAWPESRWLAGDLAGKTLGLVGLGRIGRSMARMAGAFRMRVLAFDPHLDPHLLPPGVERCADLATLLAQSDAVSIHCVLNVQTRHLLGAAQLARMKASAFLVNVSRGEIVDEAALLHALQEGRLGGAALDVYGQEPLYATGPHVVGTLRHGQRAAVAAPDLLHRRRRCSAWKTRRWRVASKRCAASRCGSPRATRGCVHSPTACASSTRVECPCVGCLLVFVWLLTICNMRPSMPYADLPDEELTMPIATSKRPTDASTAIEMLREHSLATLAQQELERRIISGEIAAGTKLNEVEVASALGVSRGPVREAFSALSQAGLVRVEKNRGVFVRQMCSKRPMSSTRCAPRSKA